MTVRAMTICPLNFDRHFHNRYSEEVILSHNIYEWNLCKHVLSNHLWHGSLTPIHTVSASNSWTMENIFEEINIIFSSRVNIIHFIHFHLSSSGDIKFHKNKALSQKTSSATAVLSFVLFYIRVNNYVILFSHCARLSKWVNSVLLFVCLIVSAWLREFVHLGMLHIAVSFFLSCFHGSAPALLLR